MAKPIIVGYDPGTTAALAIVDTSKNILYLKSKKEFSKKELVEAILKRGRPIIVTGDKNPLPKSVEKLASSFGCKTFRPPEDISNLEKYNIVKNYLDVVKNDHQRDALASALKAYKNYSDLFEKTNRTISYLGLSEFYDKILKILVQEEAENLNDAINLALKEIRENKEKIIEKKTSRIKEITEDEIKELRERVKRQENDVKILKNYNDTLEKRLEKVDNKFREQKIKAEKFHDEKTVKENGKFHKLEEEIEKKRIVIEKLKTFRRLENKDYFPVINLEKIDIDKLKLLNKMFDLEDRVLSTKSFTNIQLLNDYNIKALIIPNKPDDDILERINFPIIPTEELEKKMIDDVLTVEKKEFNEKLKKAKKLGFIQWINGYKKRRF